MTEIESYDVIVVGGGPSGMMAAGRTAERGQRVLLLEKNQDLGNKLKITGGGRCNITNAEFDQEILLGHYGKAKDFLYSPFSQFGVQDTFNFFETRGLKLVVEDGKRAFPITQSAADVFRVLEKYSHQFNVVIKRGERVSGLLRKDKKIIGVKTDIAEYQAGAVILATGGWSHPETGATGDGWKWLENLGHRVIAPSPDIVPLAVRESWVKSLAGVSLPLAKITFYVNGEKKFSQTASADRRILFTHFGLSGPLIMNNAARVKDLLHAGIVTAKIDAYPDTDLGTLEKNLLKTFDENKNKDFKNLAKLIAPRGLSEALLSLLPEISGDTKAHSITREERKQIARQLKSWTVTITGLMGFDRAVVSDGGIILEEIDTKTMRSRLYDNLYVTGDLLNINRPSGGYSLQLCWTTGYVAGSNV